jgi:hypothetical protein
MHIIYLYIVCNIFIFLNLGNCNEHNEFFISQAKIPDLFSEVLVNVYLHKEV